MSALNAILTPEAVHVLTDGAGYGPDGTLTGITSKVAALPHLSAVLAARGKTFALPTIAAALNDRSPPGGFDELQAGMVVEKTRMVLEQLPALAAAQNLPEAAVAGPFELILAGWSTARQRPELYALHTVPSEHFRPWQLTPVEDGYLTPGDGAFVNGLVEVIDFGRFDPERDGLRIVEAQRARAWPIPGGAVAHGVGGFVQLTSVTRDAVTSRILKRWNDSLGEKIRPAA